MPSLMCLIFIQIIVEMLIMVKRIRLTYIMRTNKKHRYERYIVSANKAIRQRKYAIEVTHHP